MNKNKCRVANLKYNKQSMTCHICVFRREQRTYRLLLKLTNLLLTFVAKCCGPGIHAADPKVL